MSAVDYAGAALSLLRRQPSGVTAGQVAYTALREAGEPAHEAGRLQYRAAVELDRLVRDGTLARVYVEHEYYGETSRTLEYRLAPRCADCGAGGNEWLAEVAPGELACVECATVREESADAALHGDPECCGGRGCGSCLGVE